MANEKKVFGILFWIEAILYSGDIFKKDLIKISETVFDDKEEADTYLASNMSSIMKEYDIHTVMNYGVKQLGYNLSIKPKKHKAKLIKNPIAPVPVKEEIKLQSLEKIDFVKKALEGRPSYDNFFPNHLPIEISNRDAINKQLKEIINKRKILIIENSCSLGDSIANFYQWTLEEEIDTFCVFDAQKLPIDYLMSKIIEYDVIAFQSQFVYENSLLLKQFVIDLKIPKTIIGCSLRDELRYNNSKIHFIYNLSCYDRDIKWDFSPII